MTLGFFDDILIPPTALQHPSRFDETEQAWVWEYPLEDGGKHDLFMDIGEPIKFRVSREIFEESSPIGPPKNDMTPGATQPSTSAAATGQNTESKTPYRIIVSAKGKLKYIFTYFIHGYTYIHRYILYFFFFCLGRY